jgi:hypothetical protein
MSSLTEQGITAYRAGDKAQARHLLIAAIRQNPQDEQAWLYMSGLVETDAQRLDCLRRVLVINPDNLAARQAIEELTAPKTPPPTPPTANRPPTPTPSPIPPHKTARSKSSFKIPKPSTPKQWILAGLGGLLTLCVACSAIMLIGQSLGLIKPTPTATVSFTVHTTLTMKPSLPKPTETNSAAILPTPRPSKTPLPTNTPQPTDIPVPTVQPPASGFIVISIPDVAYVGDDAHVEIRTRPGSACSISYTTPSGTISTADGLDNKTADQDGYCSWSWTIGSNTKPGTGTITITAGGKTQTYPIKIE